MKKNWLQKISSPANKLIVSMVSGCCRALPIRISILCLILPLKIFADEPTAISGIYPHLAMFNNEGECGTGAVVPWADRLWVITYGPHRPFGSTDKLYEITPDLKQIIRPESVGGTPANRMIHPESQQLVIGPYFIDAQRNVRVIPPKCMPGRLTANARDLADPANKIYFGTMEEGLYEVNVYTLDVTGLIKDGNNLQPGWSAETNAATVKSTLPGYHGKGLYSGQGRVVYAQNGDHGRAEYDPATPSGALAEWRKPGEDWYRIRQNQFTEVTGPGGIYGNTHPDTDPVWSIGWDFRSLILMCLDHGKWHSYRLPKPDHTYDGAHGWFTEWPRIRDIGENDLLMTMHGAFWRFPKDFCVTNSAGIAPRSAYLKIIGDFCRWDDRVVLGCDDTAVIEGKREIKGNLAAPGRSQSNLEFVKPAQLDEFGPVLGRGAVWQDDAVKSNVVSDPFLFSGFRHRTLFLKNDDAMPVKFTLETDQRGNDVWKEFREIQVPANESAWIEFNPKETGAWVRLKTDRDCSRVTAVFHYRNNDTRGNHPSDIFTGLARPGETNISGGSLYACKGVSWGSRSNHDNLPVQTQSATLECIAADGNSACYELSAQFDKLQLRFTNDPVRVAWAKTNLAIPRSFLTTDNASVICVENNQRWRLPKGDPSFEEIGAGSDERVCREAVTERDLFNAFGTFYELPAESAGGFSKIRPIATHNLHIKDYTSYRGLLMMSGVSTTAKGEHIIRSEDGKCAIWAGSVEDLWQLGKPRGHGGPWNQTPVKSGQPSDPYLMTGYDHKELTLTHDSNGTVTFQVEVDITGTGEWVVYKKLKAGSGQVEKYYFPDSFSAYWIRFTADQDCKATAQLVYK